MHLTEEGNMPRVSPIKLLGFILLTFPFHSFTKYATCAATQIITTMYNVIVTIISHDPLTKLRRYTFIFDQFPGKR